jgi:hypothetical protein
MEILIIQVTVIVLSAGLLCWFSWLLFKKHQLNLQARQQSTEYKNKILDKFSTAKELIEFAKTEEGKKFLESPPVKRANPLKSVTRSIVSGIISICLGIGFSISSGNYSNLRDIYWVVKTAELKSWGTLFLLLGVGLIIVAAILYFFARRWELTNGSDKL